jgi:hypothetical protein
MRRRGMATLAVAVLALLVLLLSSCGAEDVPFTVTVSNDTSHTIIDHVFFTVNYGTKDASSNGRIVTVLPGHSFGEGEYSNEGVDPDRITNLSGKTLGCFPFQFSETPPKPLVVKVTQLVPCRHWALESNLPKDWPNPNY